MLSSPPLPPPPCCFPSQTQWILESLIPQLVTWFTLASAVTYMSPPLFVLLAWEKIISIFIIFKSSILNKSVLVFFELVSMQFITYCQSTKELHNLITFTKMFAVYLILLPFLANKDPSPYLSEQLLTFSSMFSCALAISSGILIFFQKNRESLNSGLKLSFCISVILSMSQIIFAYFWSSSQSELILWAGFCVGSQATMTASIGIYVMNERNGGYQTESLTCMNYFCYFCTSVASEQINSFLAWPLSQKAISKIVLTCKMIQLSILLVLMFFAQNYKISLFAGILIIPSISPHLYFVSQDVKQTSLIICKRFQSKKELLPFLLENKRFDQIIVHNSKPRKTSQKKQKNKDNKTYNPMENNQSLELEKLDTENQLQEQFSLDESYALLEALYKNFKGYDNLIRVEQYGILVNSFAFVVERCVTLPNLKSYLSTAVDIPLQFFLSTGYLNLNIQEIYLNRTLALLPFQQMYSTYDIKKMQNTIIPQVLQIHGFLKVVAEYQMVNPRIVLYDLHEM